MEKVRGMAREALKKYGIKNFPVSLDELIESIEYKGHTILPYSEAKNLIDNHKLNGLCKKYEGFTYEYEDEIIILYDDDLSYQEKVFIICHELGHIELLHSGLNGILGKSEDPDEQDVQDAEANIFSIEFQAPLYTLISENITSAELLAEKGILREPYAGMQLKYCKDYIGKLNKKDKIKSILIATSVTVVITAAITLLSLLNSGRNVQNITPFESTTTEITTEVTETTSETTELTTESINTQAETEANVQTTIYITEAIPKEKVNTESPVITDAPVQETAPKSGDIFYVTLTGNRYHKWGCSHIAGRPVREVTKEQAIQERYTPCLDCLPEMLAAPVTEPPITPVNINTATAAELARLPGIDAAIANSIIAVRNQIGGFTDLYELLYADGMTLEKLTAIFDYVYI